MYKRWLHHNVLRSSQGEHADKVTYVELFFDLVFVFAVIMISHNLVENFTLLWLLQTVMLLMAVWWVWIFTAWITNWLDPQKTIVRLMLFALMFAWILMAISIPHAFDSSGLLFALSFVFMQLWRSLFAAWTMRHHDGVNYYNLIRISCRLWFAWIFWIVWALFDESIRVIFWLIALLIEYIGPSTGFWTPKLHSTPSWQWIISWSHMAERGALFVIIALWESILVIWRTFSWLGINFKSLTAFIITFIMTIVLWRLYFNIAAEKGQKRIVGSQDPWALARMAYTYIHTIIVAWIIFIAAINEVLFLHWFEHLHWMELFVLYCWPILYLLWNLLFKRALFWQYSIAHILWIIWILFLSLFSWSLLPISISTIILLILFLVCMWECSRE